MSINIKNITMSFGENTVLDDISLDINSNGIYAIVGRSGAGKSTLINIISGLDTPTDGEIFLDEENLRASKQQLQQKVSVIYQEYYLMNGLTVYDNIEIAMQLSGLSNVTKASIMQVLDHLNLEELADRKVEKLSGGEKQRVAIARAYLADKNIIVADEPTGNLDDENATIVYELLKTVAKDKIVIVVSHDRVFVEKYADEIYEIEDGDLIVKRERIASLDEKNEQNSLLPRDSSSCNLTGVSRLKLLKHLARKKKILMSIVCCLSVMLMTLISIMSSISMVTFGRIMIDNVDNKATSMGALVNTDNTNYQQTNVYTHQLDQLGVEYSKGLIFKDMEERIQLNYSDKNQSMYYYLNEDISFRNLMEISCDTGIILSEGEMPANAREVVIPKYFAEQLVFTSTEFNGKIFKNSHDILGENLMLGDTGYKITGIYMSDTYYASRLNAYEVGDMEKTKVSIEIQEIMNAAKEAPSLTSLYFGEGFRLNFLKINEAYLSDILVIQNNIANFDDIFTVVTLDLNSLSAADVNKIYNDNFLHMISDTSGFSERFLEKFEPLKLIILTVIFMLMLFDVALCILIINLQYRDMKKDIGVMMSFGAKLSTILGLFAIYYTVIFAAQMLTALAISAIVMPLINSIFGIAGLAIFSWSAMSIVAVLAVSLLSVGASLLAITLVLRKKNLIESLRDE